MTNDKLFKIAGWCALGCVAAMVAALIFLMFVPSLGVILEILFLLMLIVVFYALYITHRAESSNLSLVGLVLAGIAILADLVSLLSEGTVFLVSLWYLMVALALLIFGYLAWRSSKMPRGLAIAALVSGGFFLLAGFAGFLGSAGFAGTVSLIAIIAMFVWLIWLWRVFWGKKTGHTLTQGSSLLIITNIIV